MKIISPKEIIFNGGQTKKRISEQRTDYALQIKQFGYLTSFFLLPFLTFFTQHAVDFSAFWILFLYLKLNLPFFLLYHLLVKFLFYLHSTNSFLNQIFELILYIFLFLNFLLMKSILNIFFLLFFILLFDLKSKGLQKSNPRF